MSSIRPATNTCRRVLTDAASHAGAPAPTAAPPQFRCATRLGEATQPPARPQRGAPALVTRQWAPVEAQPGQRVTHLVKKMYFRFASFPRPINKELQQLSRACAAFDASGGDSQELIGRCLRGVTRQGRPASDTLRALERAVAASPDGELVLAPLRAAIAASDAN